ncbi:MAG: hypothetical protein ACRBDL_09410 [Alphaproteobacteria bacterium]
MVTEFKKRGTNVFWSYRWTFGDNPVVFFGNPQVKTNVIYTLEELRVILERSDQENQFIPVPRNVMKSALDVFDKELTLVA